jgi:tetraacyldisaccharide 4'-kinase
MDPSKFRDLISGRQRGLGASMLRGFLRLVECPYTWAVSVRNRQFDSGKRPAVNVGVPVVSVGNLTLGGTGKTPAVEWIAQWFRRHGVRIGLISRGYKSADGRKNDEAMELAQRLPDVPHLQNPDRVAAARAAIDNEKCQLLVLDDAFQHRRIARDLDIVLIDASEPFGFEHLFPRGTLREPLAGLARAQFALLTRADLVDTAGRGRIREIAGSHAPNIAWGECRHAPIHLLSASGEVEPLDSLGNQLIAAFCGIGNPGAFRETLKQCGYNVTAFREFPDHHRYDENDIAELSRWAESQDATAVVCTHKDLVKINAAKLGGKPLLAVVIGLEFLTGEQELERLLKPLLERMP